MCAAHAFTAFFVFVALLVARADVTPIEPGPGDRFNAGATCRTTWLGDTSSTTAWKDMAIDLMTGSNLDMVRLMTVTTNQDGTKDGSFTFPCPQVNPYSAIYFLQYSSPLSTDTTWSTRFTIASPSGQSVPPPNAIQPGSNAAVPWGVGALVDPSTAVATPSSGGGAASSSRAISSPRASGSLGLQSSTTSSNQSSGPQSTSVTSPSFGGGAASPSGAVSSPSVSLGLPSRTASSNQGSGSDLTTKSKTPIGAIVGGVVGGISVIVALILLVLFFRRRAKKEIATESQSTPNPNARQPTIEPFNALPSAPATYQLPDSSSDPYTSSYPVQTTGKGAPSTVTPKRCIPPAPPPGARSPDLSLGRGATEMNRPDRTVVSELSEGLISSQSGPSSSSAPLPVRVLRHDDSGVRLPAREEETVLELPPLYTLG